MTGPNNNYPGIGYRQFGRSYDYFRKLAVSATTFGGNTVNNMRPDIIIPFSTQSVMLLNLGSGIIEFSVDGYNIAGELNPSNPSAGMVFDNRVISTMWFRVQPGSTSSSLSIMAWGTR